MRIFDVAEAEHYCAGFGGTGGAAAGSLKEYFRVSMKGVGTLREGTHQFGGYRDCALREVERCLFLSSSLYKRAFDLMLPSSCSWAHVTLYYGCYYAASALLGMFGAWVNDWALVEVQAGAPGQQELVVDRKARARSTHSGSHQRFWDLFYTACSSLMPWTPSAHRFAIQPIGGSVIWQTENRNTLNYDTFAAYTLMAGFQGGFRARSFPVSLPGSMSTQFRVLEALLMIARQFARQFSLQTDALANLKPIGSRQEKMRKLILDGTAHALGRRIRRTLVCG